MFFPADAVILAIGQETAFPWIEDDVGIEFNQWREAVVDKETFMSTRDGVFFGGDSAWGPENTYGLRNMDIRRRSQSTRTVTGKTFFFGPLIA